MLIILTTTPSAEVGETLARQIVESRLAACVQVLPRMKSFYFWEGAVQADDEHLLLIKTLPEKFDELQDFIESNHSHSVPEIVGIEAEKVSDNYFDWLKETVIGGR